MMQCSMIRYDTMQNNTIWYDIIRYNTTQHFTHTHHIFKQLSNFHVPSTQGKLGYNKVNYPSPPKKNTLHYAKPFKKMNGAKISYMSQKINVSKLPLWNQNKLGISKGNLEIIMGWPLDLHLGDHFVASSVKFAHFHIYPQYVTKKLLFEQSSQNFTHTPPS